jgi:hypothetical protein
MFKFAGKARFAPPGLACFHAYAHLRNTKLTNKYGGLKWEQKK